MEYIYPKKHSSAEVQACLYLALRRLKMDARLDVFANRCKLDCVVFKNTKPVCIVKCKSWSKQYMQRERFQRAKNSKRIKKYQSTFNVPVFILGRFQSIKTLTDEIKQLYDSTIIGGTKAKSRTETELI